MTDQMTIREMCEAFDVTPRTLRFYEAKELIFPLRDGQKRLYSKRDRARLKLILRGKRFGFSLEEIRQLLDLYHMGDSQQTQLQRTYETALGHLRAMEAQRDELTEAIEELRHQIKWGERELAARDFGALLQHARRRVTRGEKVERRTLTRAGQFEGTHPGVFPDLLGYRARVGDLRLRQTTLTGVIDVDLAGAGACLEDLIVEIGENHQSGVALFATEDVDPSADGTGLEITGVAGEQLTADRRHAARVDGDARTCGRRTMGEGRGAAAADDGAVDPDLDRRDAEDVRVGELLTHLGFDGREIRSHRVGTIQIDGDPGAGRRGRRGKFTDLGRVGEGSEQGADDGREQSRGFHRGDFSLHPRRNETVKKWTLRRNP